MRWWRRWADWTARTGDVRPQALARVLICLVMAADLARLSFSGLATSLYTPGDGLVSVKNPWYVLDVLFPDAWAGPVACGGAASLYLLAAFGIATRPAMLLAVLLHAQLGHLLPPADRAVDQLTRTVLVILLFGDGHRVGRFANPVNGVLWPAELVRFQLVLMYLGAGLAKVLRDRDWLQWSAAPPLVTILSDPLVGTVPASTALWLAGPLFVLGVATIALELSAPLLLTRWRAGWGAVALGMHIGIALTLDIGAFSAGVLATFPIVFDRVGRLDALWRRLSPRGRFVPRG